MGVWDTVGALGSPRLRDSFAKTLGWDCKFHDANLGDHIDVACHALAIHERRGRFVPELWKKATDNERTQLHQVWFAGVHSDVGGGYEESGLAGIALRWMIQCAERVGLRFLDLPTKGEKMYSELKWARQLDEVDSSEQAQGSVKNTLASDGCNHDRKGERVFVLHDSYNGVFPWIDFFDGKSGGEERVFKKAGVTIDRDDRPCETNETLHPSVKTLFKNPQLFGGGGQGPKESSWLKFKEVLDSEDVDTKLFCLENVIPPTS